MKKRLLVLFTAIVMVFCLTACGSKPSTLEEYYTRPAYKTALDQQIEAVATQMADAYSDISYSVKENTFTYNYTFATQIPDVESAKQALKEAMPEEQLATLAESIEKESGVTGIVLEYSYYNADGTLIDTITYSTK